MIAAVCFGAASAAAWRCSLGVLVRKVGEPRVMELVKGLCEKVAAPSKKDSSSRDIASIGLKTVIEVAGGSLAHPAAALICSRMLDGVTQKVSASSCLSCGLLTSYWESAARRGRS
jgi:hypothetical protein